MCWPANRKGLSEFFDEMIWREILIQPIEIKIFAKRELFSMYVFRENHNASDAA